MNTKNSTQFLGSLLNMWVKWKYRTSSRKTY